jgi:hypothetical protein
MGMSEGRLHQSDGGALHVCANSNAPCNAAVCGARRNVTGQELCSCQIPRAKKIGLNTSSSATARIIPLLTGGGECRRMRMPRVSAHVSHITPAWVPVAARMVPKAMHCPPGALAKARQTPTRIHKRNRIGWFVYFCSRACFPVLQAVLQLQ